MLDLHPHAIPLGTAMPTSTPPVRPLVPDALLTTSEVARLLAQAPQTLRNQRCQGTGPAYVKIGRSVRYRTSAVAAYINALTSGEVAA